MEKKIKEKTHVKCGLFIFLKVLMILTLIKVSRRIFFRTIKFTIVFEFTYTHSMNKHLYAIKLSLSVNRDMDTTLL